jgi:hypothetical protein
MCYGSFSCFALQRRQTWLCVKEIPIFTKLAGNGTELMPVFGLLSSRLKGSRFSCNHSQFFVVICLKGAAELRIKQ